MKKKVKENRKREVKKPQREKPFGGLADKDVKDRLK